MKSKFLVAGVSAMAALMPMLASAASATHTLNVSAQINGSCKFNSAGPTALNFGTVDPTSASNATATATVAFRCTTGTTSSMTKAGANDSGGHRLKGTSTATFMPYAATLTGSAQLGTGMGAGQDKTLTVDGTIVPADFQNAAADAYTDTLTLTISP